MHQPAGSHLNTNTVYEILQCQRCHGAFVKNIPSSNQLARLYDAHFFSTSQQTVAVDAAGNFTSDARHWPVYRNSIRRVKRLSGHRGGGRLLDIGCGKGFFMKAASKHFQVMGTDISESAAEYGRNRLGLEIIQGDFFSVSLPENHFDVITMWDVLASFPDPRRCLAKAGCLLTPGGLMELTVPDVESICFRLTRSYWPLLIPPINLCYFSRKSMELMAASAGLEIQGWHHDGKWISTNFALRKLGRILGIAALDSPEAGIPGLRMLYLDFRDIATVRLRRPREQEES